MQSSFTSYTFKNAVLQHCQIFSNITEIRNTDHEEQISSFNATNYDINRQQTSLIRMIWIDVKQGVVTNLWNSGCIDKSKIDYL